MRICAVQKVMNYIAYVVSTKNIKIICKDITIDKKVKIFNRVKFPNNTIKKNSIKNK